ncbi:MAG: hypothetical protein ACPGWR_24240 [Ardenticatenaceae bacterium]
MKQDNDKQSDDEMRPEYDFSKGIRGKYQNRIRSGDTDPKNCKVETTLRLDGDVVEYFERVAKRRTTSFEMQINGILRQAMKRKPSTPMNDYSTLITDDNFIMAVAARVKALAA